jgi:hypothetical protein
LQSFRAKGVSLAASGRQTCIKSRECIKTHSQILQSTDQITREDKSPDEDIFAHARVERSITGKRP